MSVRSVATFVVVGGVTTAVHICAGLLAHHLAGLEPFGANLLAWCVAFLVSYAGHKTYSFRSPGKVRRSMPKFFALSLTNLILNQLIVYTVSTSAGHPYWVSLVAMVAVVPAFTYFMGRMWVFSDGDF